MDLTQYLNSGVKNLMADARTAARSPRQAIFLAQTALRQKRGESKRMKYEEKGDHIPPFLIASIASSCNLRCAGCYARANSSCGENPSANQLSLQRWGELFTEAQVLGVGFILLAGGEPLLRRDVLEEAAKQKNILFPVFTNGTLFDENTTAFFRKNQNLLPVLSIEGRKAETDTRRGAGVYDKLLKTMEGFSSRQMFYGASVTVTKENLAFVLSDDFAGDLYSRGCSLIFYVEYVPAEEGGSSPLDEGDRAVLEEGIALLRSRYAKMIVLSFPGDEKALGGCLAAGRGFFHIGPQGSAEPCPFAPVSGMSLKDHTLLEAIRSPFFHLVRESEALAEDHRGGCALFGKDEFIRSLAESSTQ